MNFQFYLEKLYDSKDFQNFIKENPDAYPCSGFFVIDRENLKNPDNKNNFDYYIPSTNKMFSFQLEEGVKIMPLETFDKKIPEKISMNYNFEFEDMEELITKEMEKEKVGKKIQKILFSFQRLDGKDFLVGTIFLSSMGLLRIHIDVVEKKITLFEKKSFFDFIRKG